MTEDMSDTRLQEYKDDIADDAETGEDNRDSANEDMRFINVTGGMWEDFAIDDFGNDRARLELDLVSNFVNRFIGEWNQNRVGVEYKPDDSGTTDEEANLLNGIYRHDFRKGSGKLSTDNAVGEVAQCGVGAFKLATVFEDESDPGNDNMNAEWRPIHNAYSTVYWTQESERIDKRDARYCTLLTRYTEESFKRQWPDNNAVSAYTPNDRRYLNDTKSATEVFVATRYEVVKKKVDVFVYNNLQTGKVEVISKEDHDKVEDDLENDEFRTFVRKRKVLKQSVEKTVFSGDAILEDTRRIAGKWIPIISMYGFRAYVDGIETYRGLVRKLKDPARLFNMQVSQLAENAASAGQEVPIFDPAQMQGDDIKAIWSDKNNQPYLLAESLRDDNGNIVASGPIAYSKPAMLDQSTTTLLGIVPNFIQETTGGAPQESFSKDMSGKAIKAIIKRENMNTQVVNDNIANAIAWSGTVYQAIAAEIYTNKRKIRVIGKDGTENEVQLLEQVLDEETGMLIDTNDLANSRFQAYADVGPQYETIAEQTVEDLKGMLSALSETPGGEQYLPALIAVLMDNITGVGLDPIKELNRKIMLSQGLVKPQGPEEEALVEQMQQPKEDPNAAFLAAEAERALAEGRNLDAGSIQKVADAKKKEAEIVEIFSDIEDQDRKFAQSQHEGIIKLAQQGLSE